MNHVSQKWLRITRFCLIALDIVAFVVYGLFDLLNVSPETTAYWGITPLILLLCWVHLVYNFAVYPFIHRKNPWFATLLSFVIIDIIIAALIESSGNTNIFIRTGWLAIVGFSAVIGPYFVASEITLAAILNIFGFLGVITASKASNVVESLWFLALVASGVGGWWYFQRFYVKTKTSDPQVDNLHALLSQEQLKSTVIIQSITDGVVVFDSNGRIQLINPAGATMLGWRVEEALGLDYHSVFHFFTQNGKDVVELKDSEHPFQEVLASGKPATSPSSILTTHSGDKQLIVSLTVSPIYASKNQLSGAIAIFRDVSAEKAQERQRSEFISTASHEMRTPVAAIEGYLSLALNDKVCKVDTKAREFLAKAHESTQHLGELFRDLLAISKSEDGRMENHPRVIELGAFIERVVEESRFTAEKKGLRITFLVASSNTDQGNTVRPLYYIHADPERMREILVNLLTNAIKFTEEGSVTLGLRGEEGYVQISVKDSGVGIPAEDIPHLFQKFYRVDNSATRTIGGTGLGLFLCRKIIELYKGQIWVESELGKGSTFYVNIPRLKTVQAQDLLTKEKEELSPLGGIDGKPTV